MARLPCWRLRVLNPELFFFSFFYESVPFLFFLYSYKYVNILLFLQHVPFFFNILLVYNNTGSCRNVTMLIIFTAVILNMQYSTREVIPKTKLSTKKELPVSWFISGLIMLIYISQATAFLTRFMCSSKDSDQPAHLDSLICLGRTLCG